MCHSAAGVLPFLVMSLAEDASSQSSGLKLMRFLLLLRPLPPRSPHTPNPAPRTRCALRWPAARRSPGRSPCPSIRRRCHTVAWGYQHHLVCHGLASIGASLQPGSREALYLSVYRQHSRGWRRVQGRPGWICHSDWTSRLLGSWTQQGAGNPTCGECLQSKNTSRKALPVGKHGAAESWSREIPPSTSTRE